MADCIVRQKETNIYPGDIVMNETKAFSLIAEKDKKAYHYGMLFLMKLDNVPSDIIVLGLLPSLLLQFEL